eukprot:3369129-Amphidinium_carterae.1
MLDLKVKNSVTYLDLEVGFRSSSALGGCPLTPGVQMLRHWICTPGTLAYCEERCMAPCSRSVGTSKCS